ncbi:unnamed protein product [Rotaria magnacalcarata]
MTHDGMSSLQIAKQLRKVVSERTVRRWQHMYRSTDTIDLKTPAGRPRIIRTKSLIRKVKNRFIYKGRQSARKLVNSRGISKGTIGRIIHEDLHLHAYRVIVESNLNDEHKQRRVSFTYWVAFSIAKMTVFMLPLDTTLMNTKEQSRRPSFQKKLMVWLAASKNGLLLPIICEPGETLTHENYIEIVLPHALSEGQRLLGDNFIYQQDNATPHKHKDSIAWIKKNFPRFIDEKKWPPNSPDLNVLDYYVWDAIGHNMHWDKVKSYDSLIDEIKKGISRVPKNDLLRSVQNWSSYSSNYVSTSIFLIRQDESSFSSPIKMNSFLSSKFTYIITQLGLSSNLISTLLHNSRKFTLSFNCKSQLSIQTPTLSSSIVGSRPTRIHNQTNTVRQLSANESMIASSILRLVSMITVDNGKFSF